MEFLVYPPALFCVCEIDRNAKFLLPLINKNDRSELIRAAIVLCIK